MKKISKIARMILAIAAVSMVFCEIAEAHGRTGSHRVGGYTSHGKGSHYEGGY